MTVKLETNILFVSGMSCSGKSVTKDDLERILHEPVELIATQATLTGDLIFTANLQKSVEGAVNLRDRLVELIKLDHRVLLILHSQGTYAGLRALRSTAETNPDGLNRLVTVEAYGGTCLLPPELGKSVWNYRHVNDYLCFAKVRDNSVENYDDYSAFDLGGLLSLRVNKKIDEIKLRQRYNYFPLGSGEHKAFDAHYFESAYSTHCRDRIQSFKYDG